MRRHLVEVNNGDTGRATYTSGPCSGEIVQVHWNPTAADTGADLTLTLLPKDGDTGDGFDFLSDNDVLGTNMTWVPRQNTHDESGVSDTGTAPVYAAGDKIQAVVRPGGAANACQGRLYIWTK